MKTTGGGVNRNFITQTNHDNASLTSMTTIVHRFPEPGDYHGVVHFRGSAVSTFTIGVADSLASAAAGGGATPTKVEVNLRALHLARGTGSEEPGYQLETGGYAVFRVPAGTVGGYAVEIHRSTGNREGRKVFDSREPSVDDTHAVVMVRPGGYSIECTTDGASKTRADLTVTYPDRVLKPVDPVKLKCGKDGIQPGSLKVQPMQGLVFSFEAPTRIRIELTAPDDRPRVFTNKATARPHAGKRLTHRYPMVPRDAKSKSE